MCNNIFTFDKFQNTCINICYSLMGGGVFCTKAPWLISHIMYWYCTSTLLSKCYVKKNLQKFTSISWYSIEKNSVCFIHVYYFNLWKTICRHSCFIIITSFPILFYGSRKDMIPEMKFYDVVLCAYIQFLWLLP